MNASKIRENAPFWMLTAVSVVFGLQMIRLLYSSLMYFLRDSQGISAINLAPIGIGIFALAFLAAPVWKLTGIRAALTIAVGGLAVIRLAEQIVTTPAVDLVLASIGVILFTWFIPLAIGSQRHNGAKGTANFGYGFLLGFALDTALFASVRTVDFTWQDGFLPIIVIVLLAVAAVITVGRYSSHVDPDIPADKTWALALSLASIGPWLFLQLMIFQNLARLAAISGWSLPAAALLMIAFNAVALVAAAHAGRSNRSRLFPTLIGLTYLILLLFISAEGLVGVLFVATGQVLSASLLMIILLGLGERAESDGRLGIVVANGIGQLLLVIFSFLYYVTYDISLGFRAELLLPVAGFLVALSGISVAPQKSKGQEPAPNLVPALIAAILLVIPVIMLITWNTPQPVDPPEGEVSVKVMSYNLHSGFNTDGQMNLETLAQIIEENDPDVIGLQEVSRGWVIDSSPDMLQWLSQRLDMPYVEGSSDGAIWGNAILSRYPIIRSETVPLPPDDLLIKRAYTKAEIDIGGETMLFIDTHFHQIDEDSDIRQLQVPPLLEAWNNASHTVIVGDFNAEPDSPEMVMMADAGLVDISAAIGPRERDTYYSADPNKQIDFIWASDDWKASDFSIPQTTASDHLPLVVTLSLPLAGR